LADPQDWSRVDGIVFDVTGCELGHHGEGVSFDAILDKYQITDAALRLLAEIVRAADSRPNQPHPAGEGLRWLCHSLTARLSGPSWALSVRERRRRGGRPRFLFKTPSFYLAAGAAHSRHDCHGLLGIERAGSFQ
jgi:hypothetical protein